VDEVLDLARAEAGQLRLKPEPLDLVQLATEALALAEPLARPEGLALHGPAPAAAIWVEVDPTRLRQVLMNLLSNAIKYNRRGGWVRLTLDAPEGAAQARLSVHDSGLGLDAQQLRGLFEPFNRVGAEHSSVEGTGLGLAIARRLLHLMGGDLHADSVPGEGSCFTLELPLRAEPTPREAAAPAADAEAAEPPHGGSLATRPLEVLYVEDNPVNVALMEAMLARPECGPVRLRTAPDGPSGLAMTLAEPPDLLLLDLNLPGLSGTELLRQIRAEPALASVRGVAVSANAMSADVAAALEAGFDDYVTKPFALDRLAALVQCQRVRRASAP
jgi:CheY-like chemotaxis protein